MCIGSFIRYNLRVLDTGDSIKYISNKDLSIIIFDLTDDYSNEILNFSTG